MAFVDEFVPFVVVFTLWFDDNGVGVGQISTVFVMWAIGVLVLEVPSGALADRVDRRRLLAAAFGARLAGLAVWLVWPTFGGLLVGGALWVLHDAAASGAWESLIHDELEAVDAADTYPTLLARVGQFGNAGFAAAALVATPALGLGVGLRDLGWLTLALQLATIALVLSLPDVRWVVERSRSLDDEAPEGPSALRQALTNRGVALPVLLGAAVGGRAIIDEDVPLLARERGVSDATVPLVFLTVWIGLMVGGEVAARVPDIRSSQLAVFVTLGGATTVVALLTDSPWALALIGLAYAAIEATWVVGDARMQALVPAHVRATVTSAREFGAAVVAGVALVVITIAARADDPTPGLLAVAVAIVIVGPFVTWLPNSRRNANEPAPKDRPVAS